MMFKFSDLILNKILIRNQLFHLNKLKSIRNLLTSSIRLSESNSTDVTSNRLKKDNVNLYEALERSYLRRKQSESDQINLGLEKYNKLYEENKNAISGKMNEDEKNDKIDYNNMELFLEKREFKEHNIDYYNELIENDEDRAKIKDILKIYELEKYNSSEVPTMIDKRSMGILMEIYDTNKNKIIKFLNKSFVKEYQKYCKQKKKREVKEMVENLLFEKYSDRTTRTGLEYDSDGKPIYAKWRNTMFINFNNEELRKENDRRIRDAVLFGPRLVLDFGYDDEILHKKTFTSLVTQMFFLINEIQQAKIPYHLNICNLSDKQPLSEHFKKNLTYLYQPNSLYNVTDKSYLDIFPKSDLVYLTSDAPTTLKRVDPNKVYIIGGMCDKFRYGDFAYQKAKKEGLPTYKLPLDEYFFFKLDRILTINLVVGILERYLEFNDWRKAFIGKIPLRKLKSPQDLQFEQSRKLKKYLSKEKFLKLYKMNDFEQEMDLLNSRSSQNIYPNKIKNNQNERQKSFKPSYANINYSKFYSSESNFNKNRDYNSNRHSRNDLNNLNNLKNLKIVNDD